MVHVVPEDNGVVIEDVDYDAQVAELGEYEPSFSVEDIALSEGTYLEDGELVVTEDAPEAVQESLLDSGFAEAEMSRADDGGNADNNANASNATIEYMQKCKEIEWDYENYDAVAQYAPEVLSEIDPKAGKVAELGADAYRIFRGFYRNEWSYVAEGGLRARASLRGRGRPRGVHLEGARGVPRGRGRLCVKRGYSPINMCRKGVSLMNTSQ